MNTAWIATGILLLGLVSCSNSGSKDRPQPMTLSERLSQNYGYQQDEQGNWVPKSYKKSSFETQRDSPYFKGDIANKSFDTGSYDKKNWSGTKDFEHKDYKTTSQNSSDRQRSMFDGKTARGDGQAYQVPAPYRTSEYQTSDARENQGKDMDKTVDAETEWRRRVYPKPKIVDYEKQRELSVEQSRGLLGR